MEGNKQMSNAALLCASLRHFGEEIQPNLLKQQVENRNIIIAAIGESLFD